MNAHLMPHPASSPDQPQAPRLFVGIYREPAFLLNNSPHPSNADDEVMARVGENIARAGHPVHFFRRVDEALAFCQRLRERAARLHLTIFNMCRDDANLRALEAFALASPCVQVVNSPQSTWRMMRKRLYARMQALGLPMPPTEVLPLTQAAARAPLLRFPVWIKMPEHHHIDGFGVERALDRAEFITAIARFAQRLGDPASAEVLVQQDLAGGDETKFYGVYSPARAALTFFGLNRPMPPALRRELRRDSLRLARDLDVQVFGGDCIVHRGRPYVVDFNSWPSFRCFMQDGARAIADSLLELPLDEADRGAHP